MFDTLLFVTSMDLYMADKAWYTFKRCPTRITHVWFISVQNELSNAAPDLSSPQMISQTHRTCMICHQYVPSYVVLGYTSVQKIFNMYHTCTVCHPCESLNELLGYLLLRRIFYKLHKFMVYHQCVL
jgi:hypothetical protein